MLAATCHTLYGDFDTTVEDADADDEAGEAIAVSRGGGDEAGVALQEGFESDLDLAGRWLERALSRPVLGQGYRSVQ